MKEVHLMRAHHAVDCPCRNPGAKYEAVPPKVPSVTMTMEVEVLSRIPPEGL